MRGWTAIKCSSLISSPKSNLLISSKNSECLYKAYFLRKTGLVIREQNSYLLIFGFLRNPIYFGPKFILSLFSYNSISFFFFNSSSTNSVLFFTLVNARFIVSN